MSEAPDTAWPTAPTAPVELTKPQIEFLFKIMALDTVPYESTTRGVPNHTLLVALAEKLQVALSILNGTIKPPSENILWLGETAEKIYCYKPMRPTAPVVEPSGKTPS